MNNNPYTGMGTSTEWYPGPPFTDPVHGNSASTLEELNELVKQAEFTESGPPKSVGEVKSTPDVTLDRKNLPFFVGCS